MAIQTFNSVDGFSVGSNTIVIDDSANVAANTLTVSANANVTGNVNATGNVTGSYIIGNGSSLTALAGANITGEVGFAATANAVAGANVSGTVSSATTAGTVTTAAQGNITSVGTLTGLTVSGNANIGNITTGTFAANGAASFTDTFILNNGTADGGTADEGGELRLAKPTANTALAGNINVDIYQNKLRFFEGGGNARGAYIDLTACGDLASTNLLVAGSYGDSNVAAYLASGTDTSNIITSGNISGANVSGTLLYSSGNVAAVGNVNGANLNTSGAVNATGNIVGGNLSTAGLMFATGNITGGNLVSSGTIFATGNITGGNIGTAGNITGGNIRSDDLFVAVGNITGANLNTAGLVSATGNVIGGNITTGGVVFATGNIIGSHFIGNGSQLTDLPIQYSNSNVESYLPTYTGNLVSLTGNVITTANISGAYIIGNGSSLTQLTGANVTGTVASATVAASANAVAGANVSGEVAFAATANSVAGANVTSTVASANVAATANAVAGANVSGEVAFAATANSVAGANVSGAVGLASFATTANAVAGANVTGQVANALVAGTVYTAAQPNITSVGTLSTLAVTGNANVGNIETTALVALGTGSFGANVNMNSFNINNLATPVASTDAATKSYVDNLAASGIHYHEPVYVESPDTAGNLNATYDNGTAGVGATLTNAGTQAALTIDGILMTVGKRVLIYNQTNQAENGIYTVTVVGTASTNWVLTRATDADSYSPFSPDSLGQGDAFFVTNGNTGAGETYICNTVGTITFGTTAITFAQISDSTLYTSGTGLSLTGTTFSISNTAVTIGTYGGSDVVASITVNQQGQLTAIANTAIQANAANLSGTTLKSTVVNSSLTSVGTLTSLSVSGALTTTELTTGANTTAGNITGTWTLTTGSTLESSYADLAEKYVADANYEPGTVVAWGGEKEITLAEAFTSRVAGVVSTNPAYIMNGECAGDHLVTLALQGRVPCRVTGSVRKGDMMVSAGNGHACASRTPSIGTVIGKAIENFDGESGIIEIVVDRL